LFSHFIVRFLFLIQISFFVLGSDLALGPSPSPGLCTGFSVPWSWLIFALTSSAYGSAVLLGLVFFVFFGDEVSSASLIWFSLGSLLSCGASLRFSSALT
jgi:hypothetical protein